VEEEKEEVRDEDVEDGEADLDLRSSD